MRISTQVMGLLLGLLTGCMDQKTRPKPGQLLGSWTTGTLQTEWGPAVLEFTFQDNSTFEFKLTPIEEGQQSLVKKGKYRLSGKRLTSEAINKGMPVSIWLENNQLVIQTPPEPPQRFTRK